MTGAREMKEIVAIFLREIVKGAICFYVFTSFRDFKRKQFC